VFFVVGGSQGRFLIEETDSVIEVTNQIDRVVEKEGKEKYGIEKKFSKKLKNCNNEEGGYNNEKINIILYKSFSWLYCFDVCSYFAFICF
jgi:hypothetical protein